MNRNADLHDASTFPALKHVDELKDLIFVSKKLVAMDKATEQTSTLAVQLAHMQALAEKLTTTLQDNNLQHGKGCAVTGISRKGMEGGSQREEHTHRYEQQIDQLKKALAVVKSQTVELERTSEQERDKHKRESNDKLADCNKIIHEQNAELQRIRKLFDDAKEEIDRLLVTES